MPRDDLHNIELNGGKLNGEDEGSEQNGSKNPEEHLF